MGIRVLCIQVRMLKYTLLHTMAKSIQRTLHIDIISPMRNKLLGFTKAKCFTFITTYSSLLPFFTRFTCVLVLVRRHVFTSMNEREIAGRESEGEEAENNFPESLPLFIEDWIVFLVPSIHPSIHFSRPEYILYMYLLSHVFAHSAAISPFHT